VKTKTPVPKRDNQSMNTTLFKVFSLLATASIILSAGCRGVPAADFTLLTTHPADYNGKEVTLDAFIFTGFEISALAGGLSHPGGSTRWTPVQPLIWLAGSIPQSVLDALHTQTDTPSGYAEHFGKIRVTGKFEYGGKYGHLDAYKFRLTASTSSILAWNP
jgi:hypothetical protein